MSGGLLERACGYLAQSHLGLVLLAVGLWLSSVGLVALRWRCVLAAMGHRVSLGRTAGAHLVGVFVGHLMPQVAGEGARAVAVSRGSVDRAEPLGVASALVSCVYERLADVPGLALLAALALPRAGVSLSAAPSGTLAAGVGAAVLLLGAVLYWQRTRMRGLWPRLHAMMLSTRIAPGGLALGAVLALAIRLQDIARIYVVAGAVGVPLGAIQAIGVVLAMVLSGWLPAVGGFGPVEGAMIGVLSQCGVPLDRALALTVVERSISHLLATTMGAGSLLAMGGRELYAAIRRPS